MVTCGSIFIIRIACKDKKGQASGKDNKEKRVFRAVTGSKSESYFSTADRDLYALSKRYFGHEHIATRA
ncbi:hypothetical protein EW638_08260 [Porphyromonas gingivalis]|nr:hypothetical protein CS387_09035 [Porphyromonas gingivalis]RZQ67498.1 hypothetical protein EW638_08260 [Porphyromonas gingivalis]